MILEIANNNYLKIKPNKYQLSMVLKIEFVLCLFLDTDIQFYKTLIFPEQFDLICAFAVIHTLSLNDVKDLMTKIRLWLKSSGKFIFDTMKYYSSTERFVQTGINKDILKYQRIYSEHELDNLVASANLKVTNKLLIEDSDCKKIWIRYECTKL